MPEGRGGAAAAGFALMAYLYLTLPDVRPLQDREPVHDRVHGAARARSAGERPRAAPRPRWVVVPPHLAGAEARGARRRRQRVLAARGDRSRAGAGVDRAELGARAAACAAAARSRSSWRRTCTCRRRRTRCASCASWIIARRLEAELKKSRILELYLNVIEWGDGVYGAEAAARTYFHASAAALGPSEAALLAAAIINPRVLNPARPTARLLRRQQLILRRMGAVVASAWSRFSCRTDQRCDLIINGHKHLRARIQLDTRHRRSLYWPSFFEAPFFAQSDRVMSTRGPLPPRRRVRCADDRVVVQATA